MIRYKFPPSININDTGGNRFKPGIRGSNTCGGGLSLMATRKNEYNPDYAVHPGEYLEEVLESREIKKREFAERMGLSVKAISQILNGKSLYSPEVSLVFEKTLGIKAEIWLNLAETWEDYNLKKSVAYRKSKKFNENKEEEEAERYAGDMLIPPNEYKAFLQKAAFYPKEIRAFAKSIGIHPGIIVGRLQHDGYY